MAPGSWHGHPAHERSHLWYGHPGHDSSRGDARVTVLVPRTKGPRHKSGAVAASFHRLGVIFPANDWTAILPSRTTNVSVPNSYTLSAVSAVQWM
jgi:hypothetical protein